MPDNTVATCDDCDPVDGLSLVEISSALSNLQTNQVLGQNGKIDLMVFEGCKMGMVEVAYQIADYCDYMVAGEEWVYYRSTPTPKPPTPTPTPGVVTSRAGFAHQEILARLAGNCEMSGADLGRVCRISAEL